MPPTLDIDVPPDVLAPHPALTNYYADSAEAKRQFVRTVFDGGASAYDRVERVMALGSGSWYRRAALRRAGLAAGMLVLDVACGTGLVTREAATIVGPAGRVTGLDPSGGMLAEARKRLDVPLVRGVGERMPVAEAAFDFVSMGYALRHVPDLNALFREMRRALRPGGRVCVLELTRPTGRARLALLRTYLRWVVPTLSRLFTRGDGSRLLWRYYWETIETCVAPQDVQAAMVAAGFTGVARHAELGIFSEYTGRAPGGADNPAGHATAETRA